MGRSHEIDIIERALYQLGRHIFLFGDRGVGKSSLAATAAYQYQSAEERPMIMWTQREGSGVRETTRCLKHSPSTITRELERVWLVLVMMPDWHIIKHTSAGQGK